MLKEQPKPISSKKAPGRPKKAPGRPKQTSQTILDSLEPLFSQVAFKSFILNGSRIIIKVRCKHLDRKPPLYLWDLNNNTYISSLFKSSDGSFYFDIPGKDEVKRYSLTLNDLKKEILTKELD